VAEHIDKEVEAIKEVLHSLEPLTSETRVSVLEYVVRRLKIDFVPLQKNEVSSASMPRANTTINVADMGSERQSAPTHIKHSKEMKKPSSDTEMAALVAYHLANEVSPNDRKDRITAKEIETYFKIAEYPLPRKIQNTLPNAKAAGYLDAVGNGEYKLNAVGHNLVVHSMPRGTVGKAAKRK